MLVLQGLEPSIIFNDRHYVGFLHDFLLFSDKHDFSCTPMSSKLQVQKLWVRFGKKVATEKFVLHYVWYIINH